mmetsp:Transcript_80681/g.227008  ORF Transcript_80681/g.227008 Transcript_80681/m.227008 type:complete len:313 (-) Transcript_80681:68-1006(-)
MAAGDISALDEYLFKKVEKRGIPEAIFIEDIEGLCKTRKPTDIVARLQDLYSKYQYMQSSITAQRSSLRVKLPDIKTSLETVEHLVQKRDSGDGEACEYTYPLAENIWAKASATATNCVCLWLGANCMLEYTLQEAQELLVHNEEAARTLLITLDDDAAFLRDQMTTTEVNIARCHNYGVKLRALQQKDEAAKEPAKAPSGGPSAGAPASFAPAARQEPQQEPGTYTWKQDRDEVEISIALPKDSQKTDLKVTILAESLKVEHAGKVMLEGQFAAKCSPNGSTWTMGKGRVEISLEKAEASQWPSLFEIAEV